MTVLAAVVESSKCWRNPKHNRCTVDRVNGSLAYQGGSGGGRGRRLPCRGMLGD